MTEPLPMLDDRESHSSPSETGFGAMRTAQGNLPLRAMAVEASIVGLTAGIEVRQTFVNVLETALEATYVFPLPDRGAVTSFRMTVGGRSIDGHLKERAEARQIYDEAIRRGNRAGLAEEERPDVFTLQVGNLIPGDVAEIVLTVVMPLPLSDGEALFRFPLVVAPRYIPGLPLEDPVGAGTGPDTDQTPDGSRISPPVLLPGFPNPVRLSLKATIDPAGLAFGDVRSSLHAVTSSKDGMGRRVVTIQPGERLNRDFVLRIAVPAERLQPTLILSPDQKRPDEGGTFALTVIPPALTAVGAKPRQVVILLDRSGSMEGWKMVSARRAVADIIDNLTDQDRFALLAFDSEVESPTDLEPGLVPATPHHRTKAAAYLERLDARGGTEMEEPLQQGLTLLHGRSNDDDRLLVLITDGQVGNEDHLLKSLGQQVGDIRIFTIGIDTAVNAGFLNRLATLGRGHAEFVETEDRLQQAMVGVQRRIGTPVLTDLRFHCDGWTAVADTITPARMPDLFAGAPLIVMGRYRGPGAGTLTLTGMGADGRPWSQTLAATERESDTLGAIWARARLRDLEDRYAIGEGRLHDLEKTIVATSLIFNVLCRFTAYVAVDHEQVVNPGGNLHHVVQPVESPQGWAMPASAPPVYGMATELGSIRMSMAADHNGVVAHVEVCEERITPPPSPASRSSRKASQGMPAIAIEAILDRLLLILSEGPTGDEDTLEQILTDLQQVALWLAPQRKSSDLRKEAGAVIQALTALYEGAPVGVEALQEPWERAQALVDACVAVVNGIEPPTQPKGRGRSFWK